MTKTIIVLTTKGSNAGDNAAALGISRNIQKKLGGKDKAKVVECDIGDLEKLKSLKAEVEQGQEEFYVVGCGSHMVSQVGAFKKLKPAKVTTCFASHQIADNLYSEKENLDVIAINEDSVRDEHRQALGDKLIPTHGVAHNLTIEDVEEGFEELIKRGEKESKDLARFRESEDNKSKEKESKELKKEPEVMLGGLMFMLGGDAELPDKVDGRKQYKYYTEQEARELAAFVIKVRREVRQKQNENFIIYVTNGPRTGAIAKDGSDLYKHRVIHPETKEKIKYELDSVSKAFVEKLKAADLVEGRDFQFYDFKFLEKGVDSVYKGFVGAVLKSNGQLHIVLPGESTSMISEMDILPEGSAIVYRNGAMNDNHKAHIDKVLKEGLVLNLDLVRMQVYSLKKSLEEKGGPIHRRSVAEIVAERVVSVPKPHIAEAKVRPLAAPVEQQVVGLG